MNRTTLLKISFLIVVFSFSLIVNSQVAEKDLQKVGMAWKIISNFYVDSVNSETLAEEAVLGMLKTLDPHSTYYSKDEVKRMNEPLNGSFEGVGIQFVILRDTLMVMQTISGGPSEKVGVLAGDRIIKVDDENIAGIGIKNSDVFRLLKGEKGSVVNIWIKRKRVDNLIKFKVTRDKIPIYSVDASYMATSSIGYIKINKFASTTHDEFVEALKELQKANAKSLILDLRGNGGGYMKAAIDIVDEFFNSRKSIVYTEGLYSPRRTYWSTSKGHLDKGKVVVLIDEGSASASEIVSGAIQDWDRGIIIGRRSFGKGLVQRPFQLPDGSMMRLTTSKYYTPSGRCIQKPYDDGNEAYQRELYERYKHGEMLNSDSVQIDESKVYKTLRKQRTVYGGGGIMPDLFIPADTTMYSDYYRDVVSRGILNQFVSSFVDKNRSQLKSQFASFEEFNKNYLIDNIIIEELVSNAESEGVERNEVELAASHTLIQNQIKALIARDLWSASEYFQVLNPMIDSYNEAIRVLESPSYYNELLK